MKRRKQSRENICYSIFDLFFHTVYLKIYLYNRLASQRTRSVTFKHLYEIILDMK